MSELLAPEVDYEEAAGGENGYAEEAAPAPVRAAASVAEADDEEERRRVKRRERFAMEAAAGKGVDPAQMHKAAEPAKLSHREREAAARAAAREAANKGPAPEIEGSEIIGGSRKCFRCNKRFGAHDVRSFQEHKCGDRPMSRASGGDADDKSLGKSVETGVEASDEASLERAPDQPLDQPAEKSADKSVRELRLKCHNCGQQGHKRRDCPEPRRKDRRRRDEAEAGGEDGEGEGEGEEETRKRRRGEREAAPKGTVQVEGSAIVEVGCTPPIPLSLEVPPLAPLPRATRSDTPRPPHPPSPPSRPFHTLTPFHPPYSSTAGPPASATGAASRSIPRTSIPS
jgi:hypothetical protein